MSTIKPSPIFYMGNKYKLLKDLIPLFPTCNKFLDTFGGSGVVSMNYKGKEETIYNELNHNVVELIKILQDYSFEELDTYINKRIAEFEIVAFGKDFREHLDKQKGYYDLREQYNKSSEKDYRDLYILICYSMNHLMRFNAKSEFNASIGSTQRYIPEKLEGGIDMFKGVKITQENVFHIDFTKYDSNDFLYFDPPYSNSLAVYNEKRAFGGWTVDSDLKLFDLLDELDKKGLRWGLSNVYENRGQTNTHLKEWAEKKGYKVVHLNRNYNPFSRGNSNNDEVYIYNY